MRVGGKTLRPRSTGDWSGLRLRSTSQRQTAGPGEPARRIKRRDYRKKKPDMPHLFDMSDVELAVWGIVIVCVVLVLFVTLRGERGVKIEKPENLE